MFFICFLICGKNLPAVRRRQKAIYNGIRWYKAQKRAARAEAARATRPEGQKGQKSIKTETTQTGVCAASI